ncbi:MAG: hypothetical protein IJU13_05840 [Bacteroidales bacterium]|nr:hypothetical protein [Bacteroidales bacterium]
MKTNLFCIIILLSGLLFLGSCENRQIQIKMHNAECLLEDYPDSALVYLSSIDKKLIKTKKSLAFFSLLYEKALDKNYIDTTDIEVIMPAVRFYEKKNDVDKLFQSLYYLGRIQQNAGDITASSISFTRAERLLEGLNNPVMEFLLNLAIADNYAASYNTVEELAYTRKGVHLVENNHLDKYRTIAAYRFASSLANNKEYRRALSIMDSLVVALEGTSSSLKDRCIVRKAFLGALSHLSDLDDIKKDFESESSNSYLFEPDDYCAYAYVLGCCGRMDEARNIFNQVKEIFPDGKERAISWESDLAAAEGDFETAYHLQNQALTVQDSIVRYTLQQSLSRTQKDFYLAKLKETEQEQEKDKLVSIIVLLIVVSILLALTFLIYFLCKYIGSIERENKEKIDNVLQVMGKMQMENESNLLKLRQQYLSRMFRPLGKLYGEYQFHVQHGDDVSASRKKLLKAIEDINIDVDNGWFEKTLNDESCGLPNKLKVDYPSIKKEDYQLFCYYLAGFDATTISIISKYPSQNAVYTRKNRLKNAISALDIPNKERYLRILA